MALILIVIYNWKEEDPKKLHYEIKIKLLQNIQEYLFYEVKLNDCRAFIYVVYTFTRNKYRTAKVSSLCLSRLLVFISLQKNERQLSTQQHFWKRKSSQVLYFFLIGKEFYTLWMDKMISQVFTLERRKIKTLKQL